MTKGAIAALAALFVGSAASAETLREAIAAALRAMPARSKG